jgi:hypothetical protein
MIPIQAWVTEASAPAATERGRLGVLCVRPSTVSLQLVVGLSSRVLEVVVGDLSSVIRVAVVLIAPTGFKGINRDGNRCTLTFMGRASVVRKAKVARVHRLMMALEETRIEEAPINISRIVSLEVGNSRLM